MDLLNLVTLGHWPSSVTPPSGSYKIYVLINPQRVLKNKVSICLGTFWEETYCFQELLKATGKKKKKFWNYEDWVQTKLLHDTVNVSFYVCTAPVQQGCFWISNTNKQSTLWTYFPLSISYRFLVSVVFHLFSLQSSEVAIIILGKLILNCLWSLSKTARAQISYKGRNLQLGSTKRPESRNMSSAAPGRIKWEGLTSLGVRPTFARNKSILLNRDLLACPINISYPISYFCRVFHICYMTPAKDCSTLHNSAGCKKL